MSLQTQQDGCSAAVTLDTEDPWQRADAIVREISLPRFQEQMFNIRDFGATEGGRCINTDAIASAIKACADAGGGRVLVPTGRFLTGAVHLKSNVELHLAQGAVLAFSTDPADYPLVFTRWEGVELINYSPLVYAHEAENIAITGAGTLDGQASVDHWWPWKGPWESGDSGWRPGMPDQREARAALFQMGEDAVPVEQRIFGPGGYLRPCTIQVYSCRNVLVEGITIERSPFWNIHPVLCRDIVVRGVRVIGAGPNTDGCNPESVDMMLIENCVFKTADDCVAVNSGRNADGRRLSLPCQNLVVKDCLMVSGHGGFTVGSQTSGGARWIFASDLQMRGPSLWHALRIKTNAMRGGAIEHVHCRNVSVGEVQRAAISIDFAYEEGAVGDFRPTLENFTVEGLFVKKALRPFEFAGLPEAEIGDIVLRNCRFDNVEERGAATHCHELMLDGVEANGERLFAEACSYDGQGNT